MNLRTLAWCLVFAISITAANCGHRTTWAGDRFEHSLSRSTSRFSSPAFTSYVGTAAQESIDIDRSKPWREILHLCPLDGSPIRPLVADVELRHRFDTQGTPDVSTDGTKVVYDAWPGKAGFVRQESQIILTNIDGTEAHVISDGCMPSFSPDGTMITFSRPAKYGKMDGAERNSIWVMKVDGTERKMILDRGAWGSRWSPDGKSLAFHRGVDANGNRVMGNCLRIYDFETGLTENVFTPEESPFQDLHFRFDWSKTGRQIAFTGSLKGTDQSLLAVIDVDQGIESMQSVENVDDPDWVCADGSIDWHPHGDHLLVLNAVGNLSKPFGIALNANAKNIDHSTTIPPDVGIGDACYTPDGKSIIAVFTSR